MRIIDNVIALRIIYLLVTPFKDTDAYKLGLIDDNGKQLKKAKSLDEKNATSMLHRLVWNLKRIIGLAPGGSSKIGSLAAAYLLVKEGLDNNWSENQIMEEYLSRKEYIDEVRFLEEEIIVANCLEQLSRIIEDAPTNATGAATSTDIPTIRDKIVKLRKSKSGRSIIPVETT